MVETSISHRNLAPTKKRILCVFPQLTGDLAKSAHLLILREATELGCESVVLTVGSASERVGWGRTDWKGLQVWRLVPMSWKWHWLQRVYRWRSRGDRQGWSRILDRLQNWLLMPVTALLSFPDAHVAAKRELLQKSRALHADTPFDAVLTLYYPLSAHFVGQQLSGELGIPWLALTKDFYSWPDRLRKGKVKRLINRCKRWYEPRAYRGATALVSISHFMRDYLAGLNLGIPLEVLGHCFDEDAYPDVLPLGAKSGPLVLTCVGLTQRDDIPAVRALFEAVAKLAKEDRITGVDLVLRFIGHNGYRVQQVADEYGASEFLVVAGAVDHATAMRELKHADCLFYIQTPFGTRRRLTEYLGALRPILAYPSYAGELSEVLLDESGAGCVTNSVAQLTQRLRQMVDEFRSQGKVDICIDEQYVARHSSRHRAHELMGMLARYAPRTQDAVQETQGTQTRDS